MNKTTSNDTQVSMGRNCSNSKADKKTNYEDSYPEQSNGRLSYSNKQLRGFSELCRNNYLKSKEQLETSKGEDQPGNVFFF